MSESSGIVAISEVLETFALLGLLFSNMKHHGGITQAIQKPEFREEMFKTSDQVAKTFLKKGDEARGEMLAFISSLHDEYAEKNFTRRHLDRMGCNHKTYPNKDRNLNEKYGVGSEDEFSDVLTKLFIALNGSEKATLDEANQEKAAREEMFINLLNASDEEFDSAIEIMYQRPWIINYIRKVVALWPEIMEKLDQLDKSVAGKIAQVRKELESNGFLNPNPGKKEPSFFQKHIMGNPNPIKKEPGFFQKLIMLIGS